MTLAVTPKSRTRGARDLTREPITRTEREAGIAADRRATRIATLSRKPDNANAITLRATREIASAWETRERERAHRRKWIKRAIKVALILGFVIFVMRPEVTIGEAAPDPGSSPACVSALTAPRFDFPIPCGLEEDAAFDVYEVAHGRIPDARGALSYSQARAWLLSRGWSERPGRACTEAEIVNSAVSYARSRGWSGSLLTGEVKAALDGYRGFVSGERLSGDWIGAYGSICGIGR